MKKIKFGFLALIAFFAVFFIFSKCFAQDPITVNSPTSNLWTQSPNINFDVGFGALSPSYGFINWNNSLSGWWRGENTTNDESINGNNGTFSGTYVDGKFGKAFFGTVNLGYKPAFNFHKSESFTLSIWVKKNDNLQSNVLSEGTWFNLLYHGAQRWEIMLGNSSSYKYIYSADASPSGKWVHLAMVYDAPNYALSLYVNGQLKASNSSSNFGEFSSQNALVAGSSNSAVDEIFVFNRSLAASEIKSLYDASLQNLNISFSAPELTSNKYNIYLVDSSANEYQTGEKTITLDIKNSAPAVTLVSPQNNVVNASATQTFFCSAQNTNLDTSLASVELYWDYGSAFGPSGSVNKVSGNSASVGFTKSSLSGIINWNCRACDTAGNCALAVSNNKLTVQNANYYVSPAGNDSNSGTLALPFKTVQHCADMVQPGGSCILRKGVYRETVTPPVSGASGFPIVFKSYPGETATISGADLLTGSWLQGNGSIYKTSGMGWSLGAGKDQIFVNGKAMMEARWPNAEDVMKPNFNKIDTGSSVSSMVATVNSSALTQPDGYWNGALMHATWDPRYYAATGTVSSSFLGKLNVNLTTTPAGYIYSYGLYYLTGSLNALDSATEWYYDKVTSTLYLWAPNGDSPANYTVEAKKRDMAFDLSGKSNIVLKNLNIFASSILTSPESHNLTLDTLNLKYVSHYTLLNGTMAAGEAGIKNTGVVLDGSNNTIENSRIDYSAGNGVSLIGSNNIVENCEISNVDYAGSECAAIQTGNQKTENNQILNNKLYNSARNLLVHSKAENMKILENDMSYNKFRDEFWDLGTTYCNNTNGLGTEIAYNKIHDFKEMGIYLDSGSSNFFIHNNVIWNGEKTNPLGIHLNTPSTGNKVYNNTLGNTWLTYNSGFADKNMTGTVIENNVGDWITRGRYLWGDAPGLVMQNNINTRLSLGTSSIDPAKMYVDYAGFNYHLKAGSPAINAGLNLGLTEDMDGNRIPQGGAPDLGAYEFGLVPTPQDYISYWKLNGNVNDEKNLNEGTLVGNPIFVAGIQNQALSLDGADDYVSLPMNLLAGTTKATISAWFKTSDSNGSIIMQYDNGSSYVYYLNLRNSKLEACMSNQDNYGCSYGGTADITSVNSYNDNLWHSAALVSDGTSEILYVDGVEVGRKAKAVNLPKGSYLSAMGFQGWVYYSVPRAQRAGYFAGQIDSVRIFNRALSPDEVKSL